MENLISLLPVELIRNIGKYVFTDYLVNSYFQENTENKYDIKSTCIYKLKLNFIYFPTNIDQFNFINENFIIIRLSLCDNTITDEDIKKLINLQELNLCNNNIISDEGIKNLINLQELNLHNNNTISDESIKNLINLRNLYLHKNNTITDEGINNLINLQKLNLNNNNRIYQMKVLKI